MPYSAYIFHVAWKVQLHLEVALWLERLSTKEYENVIAAMDALKIDGPALGRPFVDHVSGSKHKKMKELRVPNGNIRLLFAFDLERHAIFLVGGDKTNDWVNWYRRNIPIADERFDKHLEQVKRRKP